MKYVRRIALGLALFILLCLIGLSISSRFKQNSGLVNGQLAACPDKPNCICSENFANQNYQPIPINKSNIQSEWKIMVAAIKAAGGQVHENEDYYLRATFVTPIFRFVDDVEARLDTSQAVIHLRSASRVGDYDFGTNLKRVNRIVDLYHEIKQ